MSGIAGVYYLDGRPVDPADVQRMGESLAHRGPDGAGVWNTGPVGLAHRMLRTTPESLDERQPLVSSDGALALAADARIDNRHELIAALGLGERRSTEITDSQLILAAYETWGEACPERLIGDFAFVIWDDRRQALFCARDPFGVKPLYYHRTDRIFVCASEVKALLCLSEVPRRLDEVRVGYHLAMVLEDNATTFYRDVLRMLAGHSLVVGRDGVRSRRYWSLDPSRELRLGSDDEYAEAFRELFTEAVRCRLRSAFPVGSKLSGGLDSSAVTCVARDLLTRNAGRRLRTFSAVYDEVPESDERPFIQVVVDQGDVEHHAVAMDAFSPLGDVERVFWCGDEPVTSPTFYIPWRLCQVARERGARVLLDGLDGDTAVSHGQGHLAELARAGQWEAFATEARAIAGHANLPSRSVLLQRYGEPYLRELAQEWRWVTFARSARALSRHLGVSRRALAGHYLVPRALQQSWRWLHRRNGSPGGSPSIVSREFASRIGLDERIRAARAPRSVAPRTAREDHYQQLTSGLMPYLFEQANRTGVGSALEVRHPFADRRLVEFCLALPHEQKLSKGWNRVVMRRALAGVVPPQIQWRGGKTLNSAAFTHGLLRHEEKLLEEVVVHDPQGLEPYVDVAALRAAHRRYVAERRSSAAELSVWNAVVLALWLRRTNLAA